MNIISNIGGVVALIAIIVLTITLWTTFHNLVTRIYFGGFSNMIMTIVMEIFVCGMISVWIVSMVGGLIVWAVQGIVPVILFILRMIFSLIKMAAIIAVVGGGVYGIYRLVCKGKASARPGQDTAQAAKSQGEAAAGETVPSDHEAVATEQMENALRCPACGSEVLEEDIFCGACGQKLSQES